jgi:hypothetical protein
MTEALSNRLVPLHGQFGAQHHSRGPYGSLGRGPVQKAMPANVTGSCAASKKECLSHVG